MGDNGEAIAAFMFELMSDSTARNADQIEAAKWLADRGFERPIQGVEEESPTERSAKEVL